VSAHDLSAQVAGAIGRIVAGFLASGCERSRFERSWALALVVQVEGPRPGAVDAALGACCRTLGPLPLVGLVVLGLEAGELGGVGWRALYCGWLRG